MNSIRILKDFRNRFVNVHAWTVIIISIIELVGYAVLLKEGILLPDLHEPYVWYGVIIPIAANIIIHSIARGLIFLSSLNEELKNGIIIYAALATSATVSICHRDFSITLCSFIFPMVLSTVFNDRKLLNQSVHITAATYLFMALLLYFENKITVLVNLNVAILFGFMLVSYLCAGISVKYSENSSQIINSQASDNERLKDRVRHDGMTGLYNHRTFYSTLDKAISAYHSDDIKICLAMIDIDDFKFINDTYGHDCGDMVIIALSDLMKELCIGDKVCRYGGEEFGIIFLNKELEEAQALVQTILDLFSKYEFDFTDKKVTISGGICQYDGVMTKDELFAEADRKLYEAKHEGKNKVVV